MQLYPAIDLKGGRVVRWLEGEATAATVYNEDPFEQARSYVADGAAWLHVVDMDRAFRTGADNMGWVREIAAIPGVEIQVGGNVDTVSWAREAIAAGASRVVLGTGTLLDPGLSTALIEQVGAGRCAVALDTRDGRLARRGSEEPLELSLEAAVRRVLDQGVATVIYRDLSRDGLTGGADIAGAVQLSAMGIGVIAAGGVAGLAEIEQAARSGLQGVVVGRALYEGRFTLREALACLQ
ncbi:MAG: 1-(5-phosphoribosyl)-5-[(5-phosphoribosylamino)methylideneamino] imidazole-4-carboxamide isomerase [Gemmatimonadota bacterium]|nr:MAG: 1-(5-phosphoribosyl)-5-[(5-phosphoribosylamino)methylideneamino] imidazole-4-carboxamide isomerase [Gemmatimonadota bacterium]